jgi:hypothetical protein
MGEQQQQPNPDSREIAKAFSSLGASKGGKARAKSLSPEARSEIARAAVEARWRKAGKLKEIQRAVADGVLKIGDAEIECAVLEDGTRVLTRSGFLRAIGRKGKAKGGRAYDEEFKTPVFLTAQNLKQFVSKELIENSRPVPFRPHKAGGEAMGYRADLLPQVCTVFIDAADAGVIQPNQIHIAAACKILLRGFAVVGINALVDEATGYQDLRARDALAKILEAYVTKELRKWVRTFEPEFYKELFRLRGLMYTGAVKRPAYIGHLTNDLVYSRLAPGVLDELRKVTPRDESGRLKNHLHRRLTDSVGHPRLREHLASVTALMRASDNWEGFKGILDRALPVHIPMPLFDGLKDDYGAKKKG